MCTCDARYNIEAQVELAHGLAGDGGWVLLTLAGIDNTTTAAPSDWVSAVKAAAAQNLTVVARLSPPWGSSHFRDEADDAAGLAPTTPRQRFDTLAAAHAAVVRDLLAAAPGASTVYFQIGNEVRLLSLDVGCLAVLIFLGSKEE